MKHPIKTVPTKSTLVNDLLHIAGWDGVWAQYYNFQAKPVPMEVMVKDPFFDWLSKRYNFIGGVLKMNPFEQYDWHQDTRRGVAINMLLSLVDSHVMFTETPQALVKNIYHHKYKKDTYYVFNTQVPHCVVNFNSPRYLFTVEFEKDKTELSFDDLWHDIRDNYKGVDNGNTE